MKFTIYLDRLEQVKKELDKIARKAQKIGVPFSYSVGAEHAQEVVVYKTDDITMRQYESYRFMAAAVDIEISDDIIRRDGWTITARIEHGDNGNIVDSFGGAEIPKSWSTCKPHCEHCNSKRFRKITFMVQRGGDVKQVGKTCLKEYTGIDPSAAAAWAQVQNIVQDDFYIFDDDLDGDFRSRIKVYDTTEAIEQAVESVSKFGYVRSDEHGSTKGDVYARLEEDAPVSAESKATAADIVKWLTSYDDDDSLILNVKTMVQNEYVKPSRLGYIAYIPVAYQKYIDRMQEQAERRAAAEKSAFVGAVGQRIKIKTATARLITSWETQYGYTYLYKFSDEQGNTLVWFASGAAKVADGCTITGTIKAHNERNGEKQTVLTRCRVA